MTPAPALAVEDEQRSTPVELLWDLVFAFALTQVTTLLSEHLSWGGFARSMLVLALVWWAWSAFVWAANAQAGSPVLRLVLIPATAAVFIVGLALPRAYAGEGTLFAGAYAAVRLVHLALYAIASRRGSASWSAIGGFAATTLLGMALLLGGSLVSGSLRVWLWVLAVAIDYAGPAWLTRERLRGLQRVAVAHFSERYGLFVIICLGESIVSVGAAALGGGARPARALSGELVLAASFALVITMGLWWAYFEGPAEAVQRRLSAHRDPVLAAADGYSYLHLPIVAGIVGFAVSARVMLRGDVGATLAGPARLALCGGVALFLLAHLAFCLRLGEGRFASDDRRSAARVVACGALLALYLAGSGLAGWVNLAVVAGILVLSCAAESTVRPPAGA